MARKLTCTVTGNWSYCSEERFQKLAKRAGSQKALNEEYVSRQGKKLVEEHGSIASARKAAKAAGFKNKVACNVTGELCYISDARMASLVKKHGNEQAVRDIYVSRVAARLIKEGKTKTEIRQMVKDGTLPTPTSGKKKAPASPAPAADKTPAGDTVKDNANQNAGVADLVGAPASKKAKAKKAKAKKPAKKKAKAKTARK